MRIRIRGLLAALSLSVLLSTVVQATTITIVNTDGPNEGFNDRTPVVPIGGNGGTTLGQQRLNVFQRAGDIWAATLSSDVEIRVRASFDPLTCTETSAVLGSAGPETVESDFTGAELPGTWYVSALANQLSGRDLDPTVDDIEARFNSSIGGSTCLNGRSWYYGFDHNEGPSGVDLLAVVLHELGHGLGFLTLVDRSTGNYLGGQPDIYTRYLKDLTLGLTWDFMSPAQRVASSINTGNLVWDGPAVRAQAGGFLLRKAELVVTAPATIAGSFSAGDALFGATLTTTGLSGQLAEAMDSAAPISDACGPLTNAAAVSGRIALIDRGSCPFVTKVKYAQDAGAIGVVIVNNVPGDPPSMTGTDPSIVIPTVSVTDVVGATLRTAMAQGPVSVRIGRNATAFAGADNTGRPMMYAPNPYQGGSSTSHFDVAASPNLLMEPAISSDLTSDLDLTRSLFEDIGWFPRVTSGVGDTGPRPFGLMANFPNPFRASTSIQFHLDRAGDAVLDVYDVAGRLVSRVLTGHLEAGPHQVEWSARDDRGRDVSPGIYFYRLTTGGKSTTRRMTVLR